MNKAPSEPERSVPELLPLDKVRIRLAFEWCLGAGLIILLMAIQSWLGHFQERTQDAWGWLLPNLMPSLTTIITVLGYTAFDSSFQHSVVRKGYFRLAEALSVFYLLMVLLSLLIQPLAGGGQLQVMQTANLWLGPLQGLAAATFGVLFVTKKKQ